MCNGADFFLVLLSVLFPPIGVWVKRGICSGDSLINIALCCLGYLPGLLHAWYVISLYPEVYYESTQQDSEGGRITYYYAGSAPRAGYGTLQQPTPAGGQFPDQQSGTTNDFATSAPKYSNQAPQPPQSPSQSASQPQQHEPAAGSSSAGQEPAPPSYDETVAGDHKIQSRD